MPSRRPRVQTWFARILTVAFVLSGAGVGAARAADTAEHPLIPQTGARSVPWAPLAVGSVGVDALTAGAAAGASTPLPRPAAALPRSAAATRPHRSVLVATREEGLPGSQTPAAVSARAPPLT